LKKINTNKIIINKIPALTSDSWAVGVVVAVVFVIHFEIVDGVLFRIFLYTFQYLLESNLKKRDYPIFFPFLSPSLPSLPPLPLFSFSPF